MEERIVAKQFDTSEWTKEAFTFCSEAEEPLEAEAQDQPFFFFYYDDNNNNNNNHHHHQKKQQQQKQQESQFTCTTTSAAAATTSAAAAASAAAAPEIQDFRFNTFEEKQPPPPPPPPPPPHHLFSDALLHHHHHHHRLFSASASASASSSPHSPSSRRLFPTSLHSSHRFPPPPPSSSFRMFQHEVDFAIQMIRDELLRNPLPPPPPSPLLSSLVPNNNRSASCRDLGSVSSRCQEAGDSNGGSARFKLLISRRTRRRSRMSEYGSVDQNCDAGGVGDGSALAAEGKGRRSYGVLKYAEILVSKLLQSTGPSSPTKKKKNNLLAVSPIVEAEIMPSPSSSSSSSSSSNTTASPSADHDLHHKSGIPSSATSSAAAKKLQYVKCSEAEPAAATVAAFEVIRMMKQQVVAKGGVEADNSVRSAIEHCKKSSFSGLLSQRQSMG